MEMQMTLDTIIVGKRTGLSVIRLGNGTKRPLDALFIGAASRFNSDIPERLGCAIEEAPLGSVVTANDIGPPMSLASIPLATSRGWAIPSPSPVPTG